MQLCPRTRVICSNKHKTKTLFGYIAFSVLCVHIIYTRRQTKNRSHDRSQDRGMYTALGFHVTWSVGCVSINLVMVTLNWTLQTQK